LNGGEEKERQGMEISGVPPREKTSDRRRPIDPDPIVSNLLRRGGKRLGKNRGKQGGGKKARGNDTLEKKKKSGNNRGASLGKKQSNHPARQPSRNIRGKKYNGNQEKEPGGDQSFIETILAAGDAQKERSAIRRTKSQHWWKLKKRGRLALSGENEKKSD